MITLNIPIQMNLANKNYKMNELIAKHNNKLFQQE